MAKFQKPQSYILPSFKINNVDPTLEKEGKVYARIIYGVDKNNYSVIMRERTGIEVEKYTEKPLECVVEIIKAQFFEVDPDKKNKIPHDAISATFIGWDTGYKFFSQLVSMVDGETGDPEIDEDFDEDEYDALASRLFSEWGIHGFGVDVYQNKPMIKTDLGVFFLNEYLFEEQIDKWEQSVTPNVPVCLVVEELLLHGIKEYKGKWESEDENNKKEITTGRNEMLIHGGWSVLDPF